MFKPWKKKRREIPVNTICRNCGAQAAGRYCHDCGQDIFAGQGLPILKLTGQLLENAFALDGKTPVTLGYLIARPGFLSSEYHAGRINRYVHPVKLFWMSTLVFFALMFSQFDVESIKMTDTPSNATTEQSAEPIAQEKVAELRHYITQIIPYTPYATFLLIPIFALLLALFFYRNKFYYMYHMIFAVHYHAFLWIFCSVLLIIDLFTPNLEYPNWLTLLLFVLPGVYLAVAMHRFYHTKTRRGAVWKAIVITILYFILTLVVTMSLAMAGYQVLFSK